MMQAYESYDDAQLMVEVSRGDKRALCALIDRWQTPLSAFAYRYVHDREAATDIVQETFVRLYEARDRFRGDMRFSPWLFRITANLCHNHNRWRFRHPEHDLMEEEIAPSAHAAGPMQDAADNPAEAAVRSEDAERLSKAVEEMPHALKAALLLYYYEHMNYRDIADALGCSERGVETRLYRAREWLEKRLTAEAVDA
jgi:RNA polymerase sigma-70 factor, ECF subfamily